jgi:hypothetical protein
MQIFKPADATRRVPTYLQAHTKENFIWQLKLSAVLIAGMIVRDRLEERKWRKKYGITPPPAADHRSIYP